MKEGKEKTAWPEYYAEFPYFSRQNIRDGCHPKKLVHNEPADRAIVLVHGLSDSPYFLSAIADFFHFELGHDVYLPLLQGHGLKDSGCMKDVSLKEWKKNVRFAIRTATAVGRTLSIGGLSTGGALSFYMGCIDPAITGDLYLFAAAFALKEGWLGISGSVKEFLLRLPLTFPCSSKAPLIGLNPYRYDHVSLNGAKELIHLIGEINEIFEELGPGNHFFKRVFSVSTEYDALVSLKAINRLGEIIGKDRFFQYVISEKLKVEHASIVLADPIYAIDSEVGDAPLERENPEFCHMLEAVREFNLSFQADG